MKERLTLDSVAISTTQHSYIFSLSEVGKETETIFVLDQDNDGVPDEIMTRGKEPGPALLNNISKEITQFNSTVHGDLNRIKMQLEESLKAAGRLTLNQETLSECTRSSSVSATEKLIRTLSVDNAKILDSDNDGKTDTINYKTQNGTLVGISTTKWDKQTFVVVGEVEELGFLAIREETCVKIDPSRAGLEEYLKPFDSFFAFPSLPLQLEMPEPSVPSSPQISESPPDSQLPELPPLFEEDLPLPLKKSKPVKDCIPAPGKFCI